MDEIHVAASLSIVQDLGDGSVPIPDANLGFGSQLADFFHELREVLVEVADVFFIQLLRPLCDWSTVVRSHGHENELASTEFVQAFDLGFVDIGDIHEVEVCSASDRPYDIIDTVCNDCKTSRMSKISTCQSLTQLTEQSRLWLPLHGSRDPSEALVEDVDGINEARNGEPIV